MVKAILSFLLGAGLLILGLNCLMPKTTQKVMQWAMAEIQASFGRR
jgi:S-methylmethionine-dependent homocysteine/selenocysteine methylase